MDFLRQHLKKLVFAAVVLALLIHIGLSVLAVVDDLRRGGELTDRAASLSQSVRRSKWPPPVRNPDRFSGAALAPWQAMPTPPVFSPSTFYETPKPSRRRRR